MTVKQATEALTGKGLRVAEESIYRPSDSIGKDRVIGYADRAEEGAWRPGETIQLIVSQGPPLFDVPDVSARPNRSARGHGSRSPWASPAETETTKGPEHRSGPFVHPPRGSALLELLGDEERQLQGLHVVQARVAQALVTGRERGLVDLLRTAQALGDVVSRQLDVDAAGERAHRAVRLEEAADLVDDVVEASRLVPGRSGDAVAVHGVGDPQRLRAGFPDGLQQRGQRVADASGAHARDEGQASGLALRVELVDERQRRLRRR
ncbi:unnamed protein product, partial [Penicillium discolor]